jgi:hypothetical protein
MLDNQQNQLKACFKRALSYFKKTWNIDDYPVRLEKQDVERLKLSGRGKPIVWTAQVINWWQMAGHGDTKDEALTNLRIGFEHFRNTHQALPRPGTGAPLEFAASSVLNGTKRWRATFSIGCSD